MSKLTAQNDLSADYHILTILHLKFQYSMVDTIGDGDDDDVDEDMWDYRKLFFDFSVLYLGGCVIASHLVLFVILLPFDKALSPPRTIVYGFYTRYCNDTKY